MAIKILDKDITQRYWILQRSLGPECYSWPEKEGMRGMIYYMSRCFIYLKELTQFIFIGIPERRAANGPGEDKKIVK